MIEYAGDLHYQLETMIKTELFECLKKNGVRADIAVSFCDGAELTVQSYHMYEKLFCKLNTKETWFQVHDAALKMQKTDMQIFEQMLQRLVENVRMQNAGCVEKISFGCIRMDVTEQIEEVIDAYWETSFSDKMENWITKIKSELAVSGEQRYIELLQKARTVFPDLDEKAQGFLASAEQMYMTFIENSRIDYAPVLVEFCKALEEPLWNYLKFSEEYKEVLAENEQRGHKCSLGTSIYIINKTSGGVLFAYLEQLRKIVSFRNDCAHSGMGRKPNVDDVRDILWDENGILSLL